MAVPALATVASLTALSAYLDAKFHIRHDLRNGRSGLTPTASQLDWFANRAAQSRLLTYHVLEEQAASQPEHPFVIFEGRTWSYGEFFERVKCIANWLKDDIGVGKNRGELKEGEVEMVAIDGGNSVEYLLVWFALESLGAAMAFVNCNLTGEGLLHCVKLSKARVLLVDEDVRDNVEPIRPQLDDINCNITYYSPTILSAPKNTTPIPDSLRSHITVDTLHELLYTSGTTGLPKGVVGTVGKEIFVGYLVASYLRLKKTDRMYTCMPLYHGAAHSLCTLGIVHAGATLVLGRKFSHRTFWPEVAAGKATIIQYVGELCRYLVNGPPHPLERQHVVQRAWGNGMRPDVWEPFRERFNIPVINELYAATDGLGSIFNYNRGPFTRHALGLRGPIWNWRFGGEEVRVKMDVDTEEIARDKNGWAIKCKDGEAGQVLHRLTEETDAGGPSYYQNEKATRGRRIRDVFEKGDLWFQSGDMMRQERSGLVHFVDRLGDTFRWKSENVSTHEVSEALTTFPSILEANAYGSSVPGYDGRVGTASIVLAPDTPFDAVDWIALAAHVRKALPAYAVPVFLRVSEALEYTGTLKVQKGRLKREGVDLESATGTDRWVWLPNGEKKYVPYRVADWQAIKEKRVRLG